MESDFVPSTLMTKAIKKWWVIAGLMVLGGLAGMLVTRIHKPVFQSQVVITTAVDYAYAGRLEDYELDHLILTVGDVIDSTQVKQQVITQALMEIPGISEKAILESLTPIRKGYDWILSVRTSEADSAQKIAQWWAAEAMNSLQKMTQTALEDFHQQTAMISIESCFSQSVIAENAVSGCTSKDLETLKTYLTANADTAESLRDSILLSNLSFEITTEPELPSSPLLFRQNLNVAAGALIGLIIGLGWFFRGGK